MKTKITALNKQTGFPEYEKPYFHSQKKWVSDNMLSQTVPHILLLYPESLPFLCFFIL